MGKIGIMGRMETKGMMGRRTPRTSIHHTILPLWGDCKTLLSYQ